MERNSHYHPRAYLIPYPEETFSKSVLLGQEEVSIGRDPTNTIHLAHGAVSRNHASITFSDGHYVLTDFNSRNGTYVNRNRIQQAVLNSNDKVFFGNRGFRFMVESEDGAEVVQPAVDLDETVLISEDDIRLSEMVAHEAESAANTILQPPVSNQKPSIEQAMQTHARLSYLYQLSERLRTSSDPDEMMARGVELIIEALPAAERVVALMKSDDSGTLQVRQVKFRFHSTKEETIPVSRTVLERVTSERVALISRNTVDDSRFQDADSIIIHDFKSIVCVPLISGEQVFGALHIDTTNFLEPLAQSDMEFAAAVANEMAVSIENYHLQQDAIKNERMAAIGLTITNLAHNIKNLLTLNLNATELMDMHLANIDDQKIQKSWQLVRMSLERIGNLSSDMLEFARVRPLELKPTDVNSIILTNFAFVKDNLARDGIELELNLANDLPEWLMDESRLHRAILNLVINAKDAVSDVKNGRITVTTALDEQQRLVIGVTDNGSGIDAEKQNDICQLFYTTKGTGGSGLGLPMVQKFVESLKGGLEIESHAGQGSVFRMIFPSINA
jgi:signal transduction histidine kinase